MSTFHLITKWHSVTGISSAQSLSLFYHNICTKRPNSIRNSGESRMTHLGWYIGYTIIVMQMNCFWNEKNFFHGIPWKNQHQTSWNRCISYEFSTIEKHGLDQNERISIRLSISYSFVGPINFGVANSELIYFIWRFSALFCIS